MVTLLYLNIFLLLLLYTSFTKFINSLKFSRNTEAGKFNKVNLKASWFLVLFLIIEINYMSHKNIMHIYLGNRKQLSSVNIP